MIALCCCCTFVGFVCSRALASIGMISLVVLAFISNDPYTTLKNYFKRSELWLLSLYFMLVFASGLYSADKESWLVWVRIKLPYLFLPVAFSAFSKLSQRNLTILLYGFVLSLFVSAVLVLGNYYLHYAEFTDAFRRGDAIPMPFSHIRYTLMISFGFFVCWYMAEEGLFLLGKWERGLQLTVMVFFFVSLHILSVRSGLLALYTGLLVQTVRFIVKRKSYVIALAMLAAIVAAPFAAYKWVPSLHNKITYMQYDLNEYSSGRINQNSDAGRLISWTVGLKVWEKSPWIGVGAGDLRYETAEIYEHQYPEVPMENRKVPHNQFIWVLAGCGLIGLLLFLTAFFGSAIAGGLYKYWLPLILLLIVFSSFFTEDTLEEQIGTGFYITFLLVFINYLRPVND